MAGNMRFESSSVSPEEFTANYSTGLRGNNLGSTLGRSGSFRDSGDCRMFSSGPSTPRGSAMATGEFPSLLQCLMLDPVSMGDQKYTRSGEVRKLFGISYGSTVEDNSFGAAHTKPLPPVATEELKQFKASVLEASVKARSRAKKFSEYLHKLNKYCEVLNSKRQQRGEMMTNERAGGSNVWKMGTQIHRNHADLVTQRLDERTKNVFLNKRVRSSMAEIQAEGRTNALGRQAFAMGKDKDMLRDGAEGSDFVEEKLRRLPAVGERCNRKMKRKRSAGTLLTRPTDSDGEIKRIMHHKLVNESGLQLCDNQGFRVGSSSGTAGVHASDITSLAATSNSRAVLKNGLEKASLSRDFSAGLNKERHVVKGNNKLSIREDSPLTKERGLRASRASPIMAGNSSPNFSHTPGTLEGWEQPLIKVPLASGVSNRKRPTPTRSSSPPMANWGGQRAQKKSRMKRANLVSSVSNHDEVHVLSERCAPSNVGGRIISIGNNDSLLARNMSSSIRKLRTKHENVLSPSRLSESEESGAGENRESRLKEKGTSSDVEERASIQNIGPEFPTKKNKIVAKDDTGDGVQRQGRSSRGSSILRGSISPMRDKLENSVPIKPYRTSRPGSDKNGSKSGRPPLKKLVERKAFTRPGHTSSGRSPKFAGELDDDREELFEAAKFTSNACSLASTGLFWKQMEPIFAPVSLEDTSYLLQELKSTEKRFQTLSQTHGCGNDDLGDHVHEENFLPHGRKERILLDQTGSKESAWTFDLVNEVQEVDNFFGRADSERKKKVIPLYQRVLSALIVEDEILEFEENNGDNSHGGSSQAIDSFLGNGYRFDEGLRIHNKTCKDDLLDKDHVYGSSEIGKSAKVSGNCLDGLQALQSNPSGNSSSDNQYEQMSLDNKILLELQSVGIYPEIVPYLEDVEDAPIDKDINDLQKTVCQQAGQKTEGLDKLLKSVEEEREMQGRSLEQVAMDKLVELAYKKLLATRRSSGSKTGAPRVLKQVSKNFMQRTLARCKKFEETGKSCFSEPSLRDVIFAAAPHNDAELTTSIGSIYSQPGSSGRAAEQDLHNKKLDRGSFNGLPSHISDQEFAKTGPILNRGKKKELLLDDVGGNASSRAISVLGNTLLSGAKGKRSERDKLARNSVTKARRSSAGNSKGERKTKAKPKQKTGQLSTSVNGFISKFTETTHLGDATNKEKVGLIPNSDVPHDNETKESTEVTNLQLSDLDAIEELGVENNPAGTQDLSNWLNFDGDDGLEDHFSEGLLIPKDDLMDLNMLI